MSFGPRGEVQFDSGVHTKVNAAVPPGVEYSDVQDVVGSVLMLFLRGPNVGLTCLARERGHVDAPHPLKEARVTASHRVVSENLPIYARHMGELGHSLCIDGQILSGRVWIGNAI